MSGEQSRVARRSRMEALRFGDAAVKARFCIGYGVQRCMYDNLLGERKYDRLGLLSTKAHFLKGWTYKGAAVSASLRTQRGDGCKVLEHCRRVGSNAPSFTVPTEFGFTRQAVTTRDAFDCMAAAYPLAPTSPRRLCGKLQILNTTSTHIHLSSARPTRLLSGETR